MTAKKTSSASVKVSTVRTKDKGVVSLLAASSSRCSFAKLREPDHVCGSVSSTAAIRLWSRLVSSRWCLPLISLASTLLARLFTFSSATVRVAEDGLPFFRQRVSSRRAGLGWPHHMAIYTSRSIRFGGISFFI
jgi:hypothetical protein